MDAFDRKAQLKVNLDKTPRLGPPDEKGMAGTIDLVVSHQVFEHLTRPAVAMAHLNLLLKPKGKLVFTTPFVVQDHRSPNDYFRYTVQNVRRLLECGAFQVEKLYGMGDQLMSLAYLAKIPDTEFSDREIDTICDSSVSDGCAYKVYAGVLAVARKREEADVERIRDCFD